LSPGSTLFQSRLGVQERHKRDLAQRIYTPLRAEVVKWLDPEEQTFYVWNELQEKELYWTKKVPKDMTTMLDNGKQVFKKLLEAKVVVNLSTFEETARLGNEVREKMNVAIRVGSPPTISIRVGNQDVGYIYLPNLWVSGKSFRDYVSAQVDRSFPNVGWKVTILIDGQPYGGMPEAEEYVGKVVTFYENQPQARELRKRSQELRALGSKVLLRIDQELS